MSDSPAKRRKTSPTTSVSIPIDAPPVTPSRTPVRKDGERAKTPLSVRPSFASPTKASLARHHPAVLNRPKIYTEGQEEGKNLLVESANTPSDLRLEEGQQTVITGIQRQRDDENPSTTESTHWTEEVTRGTTTPRSRRGTALGGGLSVKPKRLSRSPVKRTGNTSTGEPVANPVPLETINPFQRGGLRRTPPPASGQVDNQAPIEANLDPFRKGGLWRSPVALHDLNTIAQQSTLSARRSEVSTTPTGPVPPHTEFDEVAKEIERQEESRSDPKPDDNIVHSAAANLISSNDTNQPLSRGDGLGPTLISHPQRKERISPRRHHHEEPDLPPTPTQLGIPDPLVTTPPVGIHNTPSRRVRRSKALGEKLKSSPLKPENSSSHKEQSTTTEQPKVSESIKDIELKAQSSTALEGPNRRKSPRFLLSEDPYALKKEKRDDLLKELQQLQADVALANQENKRLRLQSASVTKGSTKVNPDELLSMLQRATLPKISAQAAKPRSIFKSIASFLPFGPRKKPAPSLLSEKPVASHLPISLENPLPYLKAFTPLNYSSTITLQPASPLSIPSGDPDNHEIFQKHIITATHPSGLFASRLSMLVNTSSLSITDLSVLRLDMNAETELGTFIRARAKDQGPLGKNIGVVCWAMGRWIEVSIKRAAFWCEVESELGSEAKRSVSLQRRKKRKQLGIVDADMDNNHGIDEQEGHQIGREKHKWTRRQLLPHIGRTYIELSNEEVELRFEWKLGFDWTGEIESKISAGARLPQAWQMKDDRKSLEKIPEAFDRLVKEQGPFGAVKALVSLMMGG